MAKSPGCRNFRFSIDRGGTFTDVFAEYEDDQGRQHEKVLKLLSVDPANYPDAPREGIRRVLETCTGLPHPRNSPLDTSRIASIRMGTTVRAQLSSMLGTSDMQSVIVARFVCTKWSIWNYQGLD
jgi:hypothetical protein